MKKLIILAGASVALTGCGFKFNMGPGEPGSGVAKTETRDVKDFTSVELAGSANVEISQGAEFKVTVTTDDNLIEKLETRVENGALYIGFKGNVSPKVDTKVIVTMPKIEGAVVSGSGDMNLASVAADSFSATIAGSGSITAKGSAKSVKAEVTGSGDLALADLATEDGKATITGSGEITINASKTLTATITGSGDIRYLGKPDLSKTVTGSGEIIQK